MRWKWVLIIACAAFILLFGTIYAVLLSYNYNSLKPQIRQAVLSTTGRDLTIRGNIGLKIGFTPALAFQDVSFQNAPWGSRPDMARIKRFEIKVRLFPLLFHRLEIVRLVLVDPEILFERDASGRSNLPVEHRAEDLSAKKNETGNGGWELSRVTFKELRIEKGGVTYIDHQSNKTYVLTVAAFTAKATGLEKGPVRIRAEGAYKTNSFTIEGTIGSLKTLMRPSATWPVNLTLTTGYGVLTLNGSVDDPLAGRGMKLDFRLKGNDAASLNRFFDGSAHFKGPFDISGKIRDTGRKAYLVSDLKIIQGESDLGGSAGLDLAGERPKVTASLSASKLDLRHIREGTSKRKAPTDKVFPGTPLPLHALSNADAELRLRAAEVLLPDLPLTDLDIDMVLKNGVLDLKTFKAGVGKGSVDGRLSLKPGPKTALLTLVVKISKVDIKYLAKIVKGVEGNFDADLSISARGGSVAGLLGGSNGRAVFMMGRGKINNRYMDLLGSDLGPALFRLLNPFEKEKPYTPVNCFVGAFTVRNGLARADTLVLNTQHMVVIGEGDIDLRTERLNLSLKPVPKETVGSSLIGRLGMSAGELTKPFKLGGTLARPRLAIDPTGVAITLGKTIGSATLFGPLGIAAALVGSASDDETSCAAAILAARKGVKVKKQKDTTGEILEKSGETIKDIGEKIKDLFKGK